MRFARPSTAAALTILWAAVGAAGAEDFSGGGGSIFFGTGAPNSIDAASELAADLGIDDESGNYAFGLQGFYQGERYRLGAAFQTQAWAGVNPGESGAGDDAAGVAALVYGLYGTYTIRHDRMLLNVGGVAGAGRAFLGYSVGGGDGDDEENVATFYLEPHLSIGVATGRWFGVEFQLAAPIYLLTEDLTLTRGGKTYTVRGSDMTGVCFSMKLTFGSIANP